MDSIWINPGKVKTSAVALSWGGSFIAWWLVVDISGAWLWTCLCGCLFMFTVGVCPCLWVVIFIVWAVMAARQSLVVVGIAVLPLAIVMWPLWCFSVQLSLVG